MSSGVQVEGGDLKLILVTTLKIDFLKNTRMLKKIYTVCVFLFCTSILSVNAQQTDLKPLGKKGKLIHFINRCKQLFLQSRFYLRTKPTV